MKVVKKAENSEMLHLKFHNILSCVQIAAEVKASEIQTMKTSCLCGVSPGNVGRDATFCYGGMPLHREDAAL
jgi:hypothetical protein